jgi:tetratricopeptide (TPR) repeat protein
MTDQPPVDQRDPQQPSSTESISNVSGGVDVAAQRDVNIGGDVVGRDKITEIVEGDKVAGDKIVEQQITATGRSIAIGQLNIPLVPLIAALGIGLAALLMIVFISSRTQQQVQQILPTPTPAKMTGDFNVLVAEFGEETSAGARQATDRSRQLSKTVFETLLAQKNDLPDAAIRTAIELRYGDAAATGVLVSDETTAQQVANQTGAQMVIYGAVDPLGDFMPNFYVVPEVRGDITGLNTGTFQFGDQPIQFGSGAQFNANADLRTRSSALMYIITGLTYDLFGRVEQSLEIYRQAQDQLQGWPEKGQGKEILYFFLGQAAFFKQFKVAAEEAPALNDQAQAAFERALNSNPAYTRAMIGLGGVFNTRIQRLSATADALASSDLSNMFAWYDKALAQARQDGDAFMEHMANFSLAGAFYLQGAAYRFADEAANAVASFKEALQYLDPAEQFFATTGRQRELAQVYLLRGNIYKQHAETISAEGDRAEVESLYGQAQQAYQRCLDQAERAPNDRLVTDTIVRDFCQPLLQQVTTALNSP